MKRSLVLFTILVFVMLAFAQGASNNAANKVHAVGSTLAVFGPQTDAVLLSTSVKTSNVADLLIEFNAESAVSVSDLDLLYYYYRGLSDYDILDVKLEVWVEVDGTPVPVDPIVGDNGRIVFCNLTEREYNYLWTAHYYNHYFQEDQYQYLKMANSFRWFASDVGKGTHTVEVKATIVEYTYQIEGGVNGMVGKRTLIVEPLNNLK